MEIGKIVSECMEALSQLMLAIRCFSESVGRNEFVQQYPVSVVTGSVAVSAVLIAFLFGLWRSRYWKIQRKRRAKARRNSPASEHFIVRDLTVMDQTRLWWRTFVERLQRKSLSAQWHPSKLLDLPPAIGADTVEMLKDLVKPEPHDAMILGGVIDIKVASPLFFLVRPQLSDGKLKEVRKKLIDSELVQKAVDRVIRVMASADYMPLIHSHATGTAEYFFHAKGIEYAEGYHTHPHKLFFRAATVMPHLPFSHALYGDRADHHDGTVAPDVVAFIMMDQKPNRWALGPRIYWFDKLKEYLVDHVPALREKNFQVIPDPSIPDNKHSAIDDIELFGTAGDDTEFMRFDYTRIEPSSHSPNPNQARRAIWALRNEIDKKDSRSSHETDMIPGDVLLVNNWRAATAWDEECKIFRYGSFFPYSIHVHGDRLVFQINFYQMSRRRPAKAAGHGDGGDH